CRTARAASLTGHGERSGILGRPASGIIPLPQSAIPRPLRLRNDGASLPLSRLCMDARDTCRPWLFPAPPVAASQPQPMSEDPTDPALPSKPTLPEPQAEVLNEIAARHPKVNDQTRD